MFESLTVVAIVLGALGYLGVRVSRTVRAARTAKEGGCGESCGCSDT
ncbi:MAG: FeoB-associated Cys-rich membrane protein [Gemmatimonas sp.]|nr:FeoB-associated Cys-rich membrane protein [Gemmatimonas sp.]